MKPVLMIRDIGYIIQAITYRLLVIAYNLYDDLARLMTSLFVQKISFEEFEIPSDYKTIYYAQSKRFRAKFFDAC